MTAPATYEEQQRRIDRARNLTPGQARYITDLIEARFEVDAPEREALREQYKAIRSNSDVSEMIEQLKLVPTLESKRRAAIEAAMPTEVGYYRNPETGELFRLRRPKNARWELLVSKYSKTGGLRRLSTEGNLVKGTWKAMNSFHSRIMLSRGEIKKDWLLTEEQLVEFAYGFCPFHGGPLTDGVSVALSYGKDCAAKHGLPWSEEAAQAVLAAQKASGGVAAS